MANTSGKPQSAFLTSKEGIAVAIVVAWVRKDKGPALTAADFADVARNLPKIEACYSHVNEVLADLAEDGIAPYEICYFRAGDLEPRYETFPTSLSKETVRRGLEKSYGKLKRLLERDLTH